MLTIMKKMCRRSLLRSPSLGLTLIEVVASIALLSTLLVSMLTAYSRHVRQIKLADQTMTAVKLADELLANWFTDDTPMLPRSVQIFADRPDYYWQLVDESRHAIDNPRWPSRVVALQVFSVKSPTPLKPLVEIELLADAEPPQQF